MTEKLGGGIFWLTLYIQINVTITDSWHITVRRNCDLKGYYNYDKT